MEREFCIMPKSSRYKTFRQRGLHRHEIFFGNGNRPLSIKYGLVVFLTPEMHNMSNRGVHKDKEFDDWLKQKGQQVAMDYYGWDTEDFIRIFGKNYL